MTETTDFWCLTPISVNKTLTDSHFVDRGEPFRTFLLSFFQEGYRFESGSKGRLPTPGASQRTGHHRFSDPPSACSQGGKPQCATDRSGWVRIINPEASSICKKGTELFIKRWVGVRPLSHNIKA